MCKFMSSCVHGYDRKTSRSDTESVVPIKFVGNYQQQFFLQRILSKIADWVYSSIVEVGKS